MREQIGEVSIPGKGIVNQKMQRSGWELRMRDRSKQTMIVGRAAKAAVAFACALSAAVPAGAADVAAIEKAPRLAVPSAKRWNAALASEVRYYSWTGTRGSPSNVNANSGSGSQIYVPYAMQLVGAPNDLVKVELLGRGGWVRSRQTTFGLSGEVDTITDTVANGTVTYLGLNGIQPIVSLNLNVPTGRAALFGTAMNARMDPDLVEISSFGEGWNVGPTAGVNLPLTPSVLVTLAAGYTWRGAFDRENSLTAVANQRDIQKLTRLDPGDVVTGTASLAYASGPWTASIVGTVSEETTSTENDAALYRAGRRYLASGTLGYAWPERYGATTLTASWAHSNRNEVQFLGAQGLVTEPFSTNSTLYRVGLQHLWPVGSLWLGPVASFLYRDNNTYDAATLQFVPAKDRYAVGLLARYAATDSLSFNLRAEHVWTREGERDAINGQMFSVLANGFVLSDAVPVVKSTGWQLAGGFNVRF